MRKSVLVLVLALGLGWLAVLAASPPDRPTGVPEKDWHPLGDKLGIVIKSEGARVSGRLMAKVEGRWVVVEVAASKDGLRYFPAR